MRALNELWPALIILAMVAAYIFPLVWMSK